MCVILRRDLELDVGKGQRLTRTGLGRRSLLLVVLAQ